MTKVEFLSSPSANREVRRQLQTPKVLFLAVMPDGSIVLGDRRQTCFMILDEMPAKSDIESHLTTLETARMAAESKFLGEPSSRDLAADLRSSRQPSTVRTRSAQPIEIDL